MDSVFLTVLNMSMPAAFVIAVVLAARFALRRFRAPRAISYLLWVVVLFNLLCPFKPESALSLMPKSLPAASEEITRGFGVPAVGSPPGRQEAEHPPGEVPAEVPAEMPPGRILPGIWAAGAAAMLLCGAVALLRLKRRVALAVRVEGNVYETDRIDSPFVLGFVKPRIYMPAGVDRPQYRYIIAHERTHIKRGDSVAAAVAFVALALHWFNPLVWAAYCLMLRDMESSCDEAVLRDAGEDIRRAYSSALLSVAGVRRGLPVPLAFGEQSVKERVKNVLNFKKPSRIVVAAAAALALALTVGFAVNHESGAAPAEREPVYDRGQAPQAEISVETYPDKYTPALSSVPGIHLDVGGQTEAASSLTYEASSGTFELWEGGKVTVLGNPANRPITESRSIYWSPDLTTKSGDTVAVSFADDGGETLAQVTMNVGVQDVWYSLTLTGEQPSPPEDGPDEGGDGDVLTVVLIDPDEQAAAAEDRPSGDAVRDDILALVEAFGGQLQNVRLLAPEAEVKTGIREAYSRFVSPELLQKWMDDPENAPGRALSSPWPDRIEVSTVREIAGGYQIDGKVIEITSTEIGTGKAAASRGVTLTVKQSGADDARGGFVIDDAVFGDYTRE
ncbi:MAG: M56 family metallopeptidase [Oscillospiraceae bacterium]|jgi:beta-lactamase regulating signal transducer with metallopeptidase domain|nr:M56 family metallopeptidase [Oscillospiraceae bacterium]